MTDISTPNLFRTRLQFRDGALIPLETADFERLLRDGQLAWTPNDEPLRPNLALAHDAGERDSEGDLDVRYNFLEQPEAALNRFLDRARLVTFRLDSPAAVLLADPAPLRDILLRALPEAEAQLPQLPLTSSSWLLGCVEWSFLSTVPIKAALNSVKFSGAFFGQAGVCRCGHDFCASSYLWVQNRVVLLAVDLHGMKDPEARLFPCRFKI
ncbi:MAG: hypothetical protein RBT75_05275 [Anaerolineae bacterium]|jgi:hypothetical protein|nr:hypothetical protein [Anaerolineae bacterium]